MALITIGWFLKQRRTEIGLVMIDKKGPGISKSTARLFK